MKIELDQRYFVRRFALHAQTTDACKEESQTDM